jgi:hypothetical protein
MQEHEITIRMTNPQIDNFLEFITTFLNSLEEKSDDYEHSIYLSQAKKYGLPEKAILGLLPLNIMIAIACGENLRQVNIVEEILAAITNPKS